MRPFRTGPIARFLRLIRFSHTIFALPFALGALDRGGERLAIAENSFASDRLHGIRAHGSHAFQPAR